jgi:hypothetical protein
MRVLVYANASGRSLNDQYSNRFALRRRSTPGGRRKKKEGRRQRGPADGHVANTCTPAGQRPHPALSRPSQHSALSACNYLIIFSASP